MKWPTVSFGEVFDIQLGKMLDAKGNTGELYPYLANRNVQWGGCDLSDLPQMRFTEEDKRRFALCAGDLLVCEGGEVGRTAVWTAEVQPCFFQKAIHRLRPRASLVSSFAVHYMRWATMVGTFRRLTTSTSIAHLTKEKLEIAPFPKVAFEEQQRIANILDAADALRAKRRAAIEEVDSLSQAIFVEMFGDPHTNPRRFPVVRLSSLIRDDDSINYGVVQPGDDEEEGVPLVRVGDLIDGRVSHASLKRIAPEIESAYQRSRLRGDEILVSCVGSIGVVAMADDSVRGFNIARAVARIPLAAGVERAFIGEYLKSDFVQRYFVNELRTVSQPTLNIKQITETKVTLPPLPLQQEFARRIAAVETLKAAHRASLAELDALFASLQHRAFRGEL